MKISYWVRQLSPTPVGLSHHELFAVSLHRKQSIKFASLKCLSSIN